MKFIRTTVTVLTHSASPYQVELFDALHDLGPFELRILYRVRSSRERKWDVPPLRHPHAFLDEGRAAVDCAASWIADSDLVVFGWYADSTSRALIMARAASGRPWCFWGERPGFRGWGVLGRLFRSMVLADLRRSHAPIWGIGSWAVDGWRREFGDARLYLNVPYFSNLERFACPSRVTRDPGQRRILYSGSLIDRKGVDLLASAFSIIAREYTGCSLTVVGTGESEHVMRAKLAGVYRQVTFAGFKPWGELPPLYRESDLLCAPSRYDGWGLIVPEGLASGLPVIASDRTGAAHDLIDSGVNGWIVSAGNLDSLQAALRDALTLSSARFTEMSLSASRSMVRHSLEDGASRFVTACRETLARFAEGR